MVRSLIKRVIPFIVLAFIAGSAAFSLASHTAIPAALAANVQSSGTPMAGMHMQQEFDLVFIDMMIPHHEGAIAMAEVALTKGERQEIRTLAEEIVESQQGEVDQLRSWRNAWYPAAPEMPMGQMTQYLDGLMHMPSMMTTPAAGMMTMAGMGAHMGSPDTAAETLRHAHGPFDQAFIEQMIPHHQSAVAMAELALHNAVHPEIAALAQEIIDAQQREIAEMQVWMAEWYGGSPAAVSNVQQIEVTLTEFAIQSSITTFEVGQSYLFTVTNAGTIPHEFMIMPHMEGMEQMDMAAMHEVALLMISDADLAPGATQSAEVTFTEPAAAGQLEFVCAVAGHLDAGMVLPIAVV